VVFEGSLIFVCYHPFLYIHFARNFRVRRRVNFPVHEAPSTIDACVLFDHVVLGSLLSLLIAADASIHI
jgi:hypothetical protein